MRRIGAGFRGGAPRGTWSGAALAAAPVFELLEERNLLAISFAPAGSIDTVSQPTSLQFGPDDRLYVSQQNGVIKAYTVELQDDEYVALAEETLTLPGGGGVVQSIQNHNDDGSLSGEANRQVTGLVVTGTASNPVIYVTSSDPRISKADGDSNLDTNSGVLTRVTWTGSEWETVDLIRGLPRSEENHSTNGLTLSPDGESLYLMVGGNTNNGAPSLFFSYTAEYALSAALLEIDLVDLNSRAVLTDPDAGQGGVARDYVYDLPTLDDPSIPNNGVREDAGGMDVDGPWGGNDGFNQTILPADAPLSVYADGFRNAYDVVMTESGLLYTVDNGSNPNLGAAPVADINGDPTNQINEGGDGDAEPLYLIEPLGYYGHPNPVRSNPTLSWTVYGDDGLPDPSVSPNTVPDISALVPASVNIEPGYLIDPSKFTDDAARLAESGVRVTTSDPLSSALETLASSSNGLIEYTSDGAFDGALEGALLVTQFNDNVTVLNVNSTGTGLDPLVDPGPDGLLGTGDDSVAAADGVFQLPGLSGIANPLDVIVGPDGTLWVAEIVGGKISVFAPSDFVPPADLDFDDDGLLNPVDPFLRDDTNGGSVVVGPGETVTWDFAASGSGTTPGPGGYGGGLTGVMVNGVTDYEAFFQSPSELPGLDVNLDNVKFTTAAGGGATVVEVVSGGDPFQGGNDGEFLFHTGATIDPAVESFTVKWSVFNPGDAFTGNFQQIGGYLGTGDQSNYLKLVAIQSGSGEIQFALEDGDTTLVSHLQADDLFDVTEVESKKIFFEVEIDVVSETATPTVIYQTSDDQLKTVVGTAISLAGTTVLDAIKGDYSVQGQTTGLAMGLFSSNTGQPVADSFQAIFDDIEIVAAGEPIVETVLYRVNAGGPLVAAIDDGPDWTADTQAANSPFLVEPGGNNTGAYAVAPGATVPVTTPGAIFTTERFDNAPLPEMAYSFPVQTGEQYEVRLYLGNGFGDTSAPDTRVFDVAIEGTVLANFDNIDLSDQFGHLTGGMISSVVTVTDGSLDIEFLHDLIENPLVNGIEIIQLGVPMTSSLSVAPPTPSSVVESGDTGFTQLAFPITFSEPPGGNVTVVYSVNINGVVSSGLTLALGTADGVITVDVSNDDLNDGDESVTVTLTGFTQGALEATLGTTVAVATVTEDDQVTTPADLFNGAAIANDDYSGGNLSPTQVILSLGANTVVASQDTADLDYLTFEVQADQQLTEINLFAYDGGANSTLLGLHTGGGFADEATLNGAGSDLSALLDGATLYEGAQVGTGLLDELASTTIEGDGRTVAGLTTPLGPGLYTLWFQQDVGTTTTTLELVTQSTAPGGVGGAYLPNANGNFVFEAESALDPGAGGFEFLTTSDLPGGHEAPSGGAYVVATTDNPASPSGETLTYQFTPDQTGFVRVNLVASHLGAPSDNNDSWVKIEQNGTTVFAIDQEVPLDDVDGAYKTFSISGTADEFLLAQRNVDGNGQPIVMPVTTGLTYDFLLTERSVGHEVDKIVLEFFTTAPTAFGSESVVKSEPPSPQVVGDPVGSASFSIDLEENDVQESNFGPDSFEITNTGDKNIEMVVIDISNAILPDAVFDPFGEAGDTVAKLLSIDTAGGTGVIAPDHGTSGAPGTAYVGAGGLAGFEGIQLFFDSGDSGGFNPGETIGFSIDTDPNSIAGAGKSVLDGGADPAWDVGGVSGAELIGSTYTVTFTDGTTATGTLQGVDNQAGAYGVASQDSPDLAATLTVNGLGAGGVGVYESGGPTVEVDGPAGFIARVVLMKGITQPVDNNFSEPYASQLDAQLATLAASDFPANNAAEFQTVDVLLTGAPIDISGLFDFTQVPLFELAVPEDEVPLAFVVGVIDPLSGDPLGDVADAIYLVDSGLPDADLELSMTVSDSAPPVGSSIDFTLTVDNLGPEDAPGVQVTDLLPDGYTFDGASGDGAYDDATGLWDLGTVAASASASLVITVTVNESDPIPLDYANYAEITASGAFDLDSTPGNASTTEDDDAIVAVSPINPQADLELSMTVSDSAPLVGTQVDFTLTVDNLGPDDASAVQVTDLLPDGYAFVEAVGDGTYNEVNGQWDIGAIPNSGSATLVITVTVLESDPLPLNYENYAEITASDQGDPDSTPSNQSTDEDDGLIVAVTPFSALLVTAFQPTASGFDVSFNQPLDLSALNLYTGVGGGPAAADLTVTKDGAPVAGSVVYDAMSDTLRFVKTGGGLEPGLYDVTLTSGADAFVATSADLLLGNEPNGDYTDSFTVAAPSSATLSIPDFARGPGQDLDATPADGLDAHLPIVLDSVSGLQIVEVDLLFDPAVMQVSGVTSPIAELIVSASFDNLSGVVSISSFSATPISGADLTLFDVAASVPSGAEYGAAQVLELVASSGSTGILNEGAIAVTTDAAVHKAVFLGDTDKSQAYNPNDAGLIPTVYAGGASGFAAYPLTDPVIVADVSGNGSLSVFDPLLLNPEFVGIDAPEIPPLPPGSGSAIEATFDPAFGVPAVTYAKSGDDLTLPVTLDVEPGAEVYAVGFSATADSMLLAYGGRLDGADAASSDWAFVENEVSPGVVMISGFNTLGQALSEGVSEIALLDYTVSESAVPGDTVTLVATPLDAADGGLVWTPASGDVIVTYASDHNRDGTVDSADYDLWASTYGSTTQLAADANNDGVVNTLDYLIWREEEGATVVPPPPASLSLSEEIALSAPQATGLVITPTVPAADPAASLAVGSTADTALLLLLDSGAAVEEDHEEFGGASERDDEETDVQIPGLEAAFAAL